MRRKHTAGKTLGSRESSDTEVFEHGKQRRTELIPYPSRALRARSRTGSQPYGANPVQLGFHIPRPSRTLKIDLRETMGAHYAKHKEWHRFKKRYPYNADTIGQLLGDRLADGRKAKSISAMNREKEDEASPPSPSSSPRGKNRNRSPRSKSVKPSKLLLQKIALQNAASAKDTGFRQLVALPKERILCRTRRAASISRTVPPPKHPPTRNIIWTRGLRQISTCP